MPTVALYNTNGEQVGEVELKEDIFGVPVHGPVLHDAVVMQLAGRRRGTHDTKTRAEVQGGGRKPWRQKGTGRARHGTIRSPIWRGGGVVLGGAGEDGLFDAVPFGVGLDGAGEGERVADRDLVGPGGGGGHLRDRAAAVDDEQDAVG